ncbi:MAG TPA: hypothetical protein DIT07_08605 [Sphingobacteriaceae bacterium]|nr:hypothetical protein [Sphingobacteriaceae bacterium]
MKPIPPPHSQNQEAIKSSADKLQRILESQKFIREAKSKQITFSQPILWQSENPVFFPKTINVIQGKAGVHKSRLAETICAALLKKPDCTSDVLKFHSDKFRQFAICYVDTERNLSDQLPYALQQIQTKAGYEIMDHPTSFDYISLLEFGREDRYDMLNVYLEHVRIKFNTHIFIVLDVITDCVFNFNDTKDSMKLIDMMNQSINRYDVTFLCLIHENPGQTDKARGHLGTEILNKASTVIQIGFERDADNHALDLLKIVYLKCRSSRKHDPFYVQDSEQHTGLIISDPESVQRILNAKNLKGDLETTLDLLAMHLKEPMPRRQLMDLLMEELNCKERLLESRLKQIISTPIQIENFEGEKFYLSKKPEGKEIVYFLVES